LDATGQVDLAALEVLFAARPGRRSLLTLQMANNETGILQPVAEVAALAARYNVIVHTDAVQVAGRLPLDMAATGASLMSLTAHKLGGPKGIGALVVRDGTRLPPFLLGGGQERRRRAGTENVAGIAGFGAAADAAGRDVSTAGAVLAGLRDRLEAGIAAVTPEAWIVGDRAPRLPNTSSVVWPGHSAETLVIKLDLAGVAVSAGAACSSGKVGASPVLLAMGITPDVARAAIRVSFGWQSSERDLESFLSVWRAIAASAARPRRAVA
jgi:cysteine desulfurase